MDKKQKNFSIGYFILALALMFVSQYFLFIQSVETLSYSQFKTLLKHGQVTDIVVREKEISGAIKPEALKEIFTPQKITELGERAKKPLSFHVVRVEDPKLTAELEEKVIPFKGETTSDWLPIILSWVLPVIIFFAFWTFLSNRMGGASGGLMQIGKSKAKVYIEKTTGVTFADVEGIDEAEEELIEVVEFLKHPEKYQRLGGHLPKGVLLVGPPGTGKTLLARAVAGEAGVPFFSISGSDFVEMFVGVGAARVRDLFAQAAANAPSIIFIDELDALGKARGINMLSSHDEREQTLNQLLAEMDGFDPNKNVIMMAATNRPEILDPALLRPGRFDRQVLVDRPDVKGREKILLLHAKKIKLAPSVDLALIAAKT
ncbi:MAG TPA: ATP-dependent metallopeptidase FtsH/Yme1/Tma family protein, partial [Candidatus Binatia bacterium]|nr:ATP-dependent metallopeptidase FtsH/Yme1/Tma family protein [Candidatus Binatia bacterium]